jgi:hypothetical protein
MKEQRRFADLAGPEHRHTLALAQHTQRAPRLPPSIVKVLWISDRAAVEKRVFAQEICRHLCFAESGAQSAALSALIAPL